MDELPGLLLEAVGDATVIETIGIGGGDVVAVTSAETHLYRSEGLLSEESVETFSHDIERLSVDSGRRKRSIRFEGLDTERSFTVSAKVADAVVEAVLEGVLRTTGVVAPEETVRTQFRFSELTLVVTDHQLLKHIGSAVWNEEFETATFAELTDLDFESGSVATQVVIESDGRRQRVKVPNDHAGRVQEAVQSAVFEYHGVSSLGGLRASVEEANEAATAASENGDELSAGRADEESGTDDTDADRSDDEEVADDGFVSADWSPPADQDPTGAVGRNAGSQTTPEVETEYEADDADTNDIGELRAEIEELRAQLKYQTELLESQGATIEQLVDELRRGR